jgi:hypothetical protein
MIYFVIALLILVTVLVGIVAFLINAKNDRDEDYNPCSASQKIKEVNKKIEVIKNEKSNDAVDCSNSLNSMDL